LWFLGTTYVGGLIARRGLRQLIAPQNGRYSLQQEALILLNLKIETLKSTRVLILK
jgi:hypothetical protein